MELFNTLTGAVESFQSGEEVKLYVCGVTPYDTTHLGHARTYLLYDVLIRHLMRSGKKVDYVQNITDIDDSILARARHVGEEFDALGDRFTAIYFDDIAKLGMLPARSYPKATDAIPEIVTMIRGLLEDGHAYEKDGDVYFRVDSAADYGSFSRLSRAEMIEIEGAQDGSTVADPRKQDPLDLLLWRNARGSDPSWESPWGRGLPGWHIECSVVAMTHLGASIDIHGGGEDLVFPHHEAEIAQCETYTGVAPFARFWVHVAMARLNGRKMSKSEGNMIFVRDLLESFSPDAIRLYTLGTHYRSPLEFDAAGLSAARDLARNIARAAGREAAGGGRQASSGDGTTLQGAFDAALDNDLDTPGAISVLAAAANSILTSTADPTYEARRDLRRSSASLGLQLETESS